MSAEAWPGAPALPQPDTLRNRKIVGLWLFAICGLIGLMVLVGGLTRLTNSGLSITEWRPITGVVPPLSDTAWQAEFAKYQRIPEYIELNQGMSLAAFKSIFWWEWGHRLLGRLIGVAFLVPFLYFLARGRIERALAPRLVVMFLLGAAQGALGWYMVKSGLVDRTDVSQYRLTAHLGFAFVIYGFILWTALGLVAPGAKDHRHDLRALRNGACVLTGLIFLQVLLGALVAGLNAGLTYNTWPLMDGRFVPTGLLPEQPWWINMFETIETVQFDHRMMAYIVTLATLGLWLAARRSRPPAGVARALDVLVVLVLGQVALGILTLLHAVPISLGAAHQIGALAVFSGALAAAHALVRATRPRPDLAVVAG